MRVLFLTMDAPEVTYVEGLFLPIFAGLRTHGIQTHILQFRWGPEEVTKSIAQMCSSAGVGYQAVRVSRWPTASIGAMLTAVAGAWPIRSAIRRFRPDVLIVRNIFTAIGTFLVGTDRVPTLIYDADGLSLDARVEDGTLNPTGALYRMLRDIETQMTIRSAAVLSRTPFNRDVIRARAGASMRDDQFHIVSCGRDENVFFPTSPKDRAMTKEQLGFSESDPIVAYVGSVWPQYRIADIAIHTRALLNRCSSTRLLMLTGHVEQARSAIAQIDSEIAASATIMRVAPADVPRILSVADVGMSLYHVTHQTRAGSPIKHGEYLLCGVPIIGTPCVGNTLPALDAGVFFDERRGPDAAAEWVLGEIIENRALFRERARTVGVNHFSLTRTVDEYRHAIEFSQGRLALSSEGRA